MISMTKISSSDSSGSVKTVFMLAHAMSVHETDEKGITSSL
jgi:hypothetical protein